MEKQTDEFQGAVNELYDWIAHRLVKDKMPREQVIALLVEQEISEETASRMVNEVAEEWKQKADKKSSWNMKLGGVVLVGGVILSAVYSFETYWMVVLAGVILFFSGAVKLYGK